MGKLRSAEATVASLEVAQRESSVRIITLKKELSTKVEQHRKAEGEVSHLQATIRDLDVCATQLLAHTTEAQKEVALVKEEVVEAWQEATTVKDVAATAANKA